MVKRGIRFFGLLSFCFAVLALAPRQAYADTAAEYQTSTTMLVRVDDMNTTLYEEPHSESEVVGEAENGQTYTILELADDGWMKIEAGDVEGYLNTVQAAATVMENGQRWWRWIPAEQLREEIVNYALQFVGGRYVYGGTDPHTGADCSGFTSYIMRHAAGVELPPFLGGSVGLRPGGQRGGDAAGRFDLLQQRRPCQSCGDLYRGWSDRTCF